MVQKMRWGESRLFRKSDQVTKIRLPKQSRFVLFMEDEIPVVMPIDEPGVYEIDIPEVKPGATFPVLLTVVRAKDAHLFAAMDKERATSIVKSAVVAATAPGTIQRAL